MSKKKTKKKSKTQKSTGPYILIDGRLESGGEIALFSRDKEDIIDYLVYDMCPEAVNEGFFQVFEIRELGVETHVIIDPEVSVKIH